MTSNTNKDVREQLAELEKLAEIQKHLIKSANFTKASESNYQAKRAMLLERIANYQSQLDRLDNEWFNAPDIIEQAQARLDKLNQEIKALRHRKVIAELLKIQSEMAELAAKLES